MGGSERRHLHPGSGWRHGPFADVRPNLPTAQHRSNGRYSDHVRILKLARPGEGLHVKMGLLLRYFLLWLDGHTIIQTCFSLLYLQEGLMLSAKPANDMT